MQQVTIDEAKAHLPDLIEAALNGVEVVIAKDEQPVVKLVPVIQPRPQPKFGSARGLITISDDFDEPLEDFKEYME
jgi:antitoxin (DNA-binding transcriptional repressor) of toxin-antitoxin stability system